MAIAENERNAELLLEKIFYYMNRLVDEREFSATIQTLTEMGKTLVNADRASFWFWDKRKGEHWTIVALDHARITVPEGRGIVGASITTGETILIADAGADPRFDSSVDRSGGYDTRSVRCMPVTDSRGRVIGAYQAINKLNGDGTVGVFTEEDKKRLALAAVYCGKTLESYLLLSENQTDLTTKLRNRKGFYEYYNKRVLPYLIAHPVSVAMGDIDFFDITNQIYGSAGGDEVLRSIADLMLYHVEIDDEVIRWENDRFVLLLSGKTAQKAKQEIDDLRKTIEETVFTHRGHEIHVTMSFGICELDYEKSSDENLAFVETALQRAKEAGRNTVCIAEK